MINKKKKQLLCELAENKCEHCKEEFPLNKLEIHRIWRGVEGGNYHFRNCMVLCKEHHRSLHANEFDNVRGK